MDKTDNHNTANNAHEDLCEYKKQRNFIDNKELYEQFKKWKEALKVNPNARMPEYIGKAILIIVNGFIHYYKFRGYQDLWKDQMIADAIYNCVKYSHNFDADKYTNPHAYLTQIAYMAFINRIPKEQTENALKWKMLVEISGEIEDEDFEQHVTSDFLDDISQKLGVFEKSLERKKENIKNNTKSTKSTKSQQVTSNSHNPSKPNLLGI